jgi:hypothetical protein
MKTKQQKYEEAIERNIHSIMNTPSKRAFYRANYDLAGRKHRAGIRQGDTRFDELLVTL